VSPYRAEIEEFQAGGFSYAHLALALGGRDVPVPDREAITAHSGGGHLLPGQERRSLLAPRLSRQRSPSGGVPAAAALEGALDQALQGILGQIQAGDLSQAGSLTQVAGVLLKVHEASRRDSEPAARKHEAAFIAAVEIATGMFRNLSPVLGREGARRQAASFLSALRASVAIGEAAGGEPGRPCVPEPALFADGDGQPWASWDRERMKLFRAYLDDELIWQRFLADLKADPARYYPPGASGDLAGSSPPTMEALVP